MKIYIAGKITGDQNYRKKFEKAKENLEVRGYTVMNPAVLPDGFEYEDYLHINFSMIDVCEAVYFLKDTPDSPGAMREYEYAIEERKMLVFEKGRLEEMNK